MPEKILLLNHSLRTDFFKNIKVELEKKKKKVFIFYGPREVEDFVIKNSEILLPTPSKLIKKKLNLNFSNKLLEIEKYNTQCLNRLLIASERDLGYYYRSGNYKFAPTMNYSRLQTQHFLSSLNYAFELVEKVFKKIQPDLVLSGSTNSMYQTLFFLLSNDYKIPIYINRRSKILFDRFFWTSKFSMFNDNTRTFKSMTKVSIFSKDYIKKFKKKQNTVTYIKQNWDNHSDFLSNQFRYLFNVLIHNTVSLFNKDYNQREFFSRLFFFLGLIKAI